MSYRKYLESKLRRLAKEYTDLVKYLRKLNALLSIHPELKEVISNINKTKYKISTEYYKTKEEARQKGLVI